MVRLAAVVLLVSLLPLGCGGSPTSTTQLWQAKTVRTPMQSVVVLGAGVTESGRRTLEDGFVRAFAARGVNARPSYELFPTLPDKETARSAVVAAGFDGALVANLRSIRETPTHAPGGAVTKGGLWDSYYVPAASYYTVVQDEEVNVETTLWDLRDKRGTLVWSAVTKTTNPASGSDMVNGLTKEVVPKLEDGGLLPKRP